MRRRRVCKKKNEKLTGIYLAELLPNGIVVESQFYLKEQILDEQGKVIRQFLYIDFAFTLRGQRYFVEFDGSQHHRVVKKWGGAESLRKQKIRDEWLREYCANKGIKLIQIDGRKIRGLKIQTELRRHLGSHQ